MHERKSMATETSSQGRMAKLFGFSAEEHGDSQWTADSTAEMEVICLGLSRSGTTSVRAALAMLGYDPVHHGVVSSPFLVRDKVVRPPGHFSL
jgi:hypothetical protein